MIEQLKGKNIAIVEDNVTNMAVFATALRAQGCTILQDNWTTNPINILLNHHQSQPIDIILLDLMLRYKNSGYDVFEKIKETSLSNIPVVAISSLDPASEIPKLQEAGFAGFISKPISVMQFPQQLIDVLNGKDVWITSR